MSSLRANIKNGLTLLVFTVRGGHRFIWLKLFKPEELLALEAHNPALLEVRRDLRLLKNKIRVLKNRPRTAKRRAVMRLIRLLIRRLELKRLSLLLQLCTKNH